MKPEYLTRRISMGCFGWPLACLLVAFGLLSGPEAQAAMIDIIAEDPGVTTPRDTTATMLSFNNLPRGPLGAYQFAGGSAAGWGAVDDVQPPAGDITEGLRWPGL